MDAGFSGDMAYDLRQRYAKIVGDHLEDITEARKNKNYPDWFDALEDLYTIVRHKFKDKKGKKKKAKEKNNKKVTYSSLRKNLCEIANDNQNAWLGKSQDQAEIGNIESALRKIEMFLYEKMNDANMFGSKRDQEGLI